MPTYIISAASALFTRDRKEQLAGAITAIHREETGADNLFARVAFRSIEPTECFLGGRALSTPHCFIDARIRSGRSKEVRDRLTARIVDAASDILDVPQPAVWLYLVELPPHAMIEYGHKLPDPGGEADWMGGLNEADRAFIGKSVGTGERR